MQKTTTGLTGLAVSKNPRHTLNVIYNKILRVLDKFPPEAAYKKHTKDLIDAKLALVLENECSEDIESKMKSGQIEEVIIQAENELCLSRVLLAHKVWEPLIEEAPPNQWTWPPHKK